MDISRTQVGAYVGAGVTLGAGFTALRSTAPKALALGAATGLVAGAAQSFVHDRTGSSELGWGAAALAGAGTGALLLRGSVGHGLSPLKAGGIGAGIGLATGVFAPIVAGVLLAQLQPDAA